MIGRECADVAADGWLDVVAGFTVMDDWSARDLQRREMALEPRTGQGQGLRHLARSGAGHPRGAARRRTACPAARWSPGSTARSGAGASWPTSTTRGATLIAHASRDTRLRPGDVIGSGTVGTGCILELGLVHGRDRYPYLVSGDEVELEVEGIGVLRNRIA